MNTTHTHTTAASLLCDRLSYCLSAVHAVDRIASLLGLPPSTVANLLAPVMGNTEHGKGPDIARLDALLHTAKAFGLIEEYAIWEAPAAATGPDIGAPRITVETTDAQWLEYRIALPGAEVLLALPGASEAAMN
ncbi:hypothetical protein [Nitratidesulfovibrio liaohensis]|uniref:Uncharacterized protein n=1 Tax=Nitratidesulfovibrio liaohensis TaxID=2604158 RepID=A0ABY9R3Q4_9BACT|nr:hypothetical protein [Nitratidesulfovibrio liaohensis]WMW65205.1 hypothetical protein KPS_003314 [Nitratidesulfovibrio liaohensis]